MGRMLLVMECTVRSLEITNLKVPSHKERPWVSFRTASSIEVKWLWLTSAC